MGRWSVQYSRLNIQHIGIKHPNKGLPSISENLGIVLCNRLIRLFQVSRFLILTALAGIMLCYYFTGVGLWKTDTGTSARLLNILTALAGGMLPVFATLDARSRFQDYKKAKDLFFKNGFKPRIANLFIHSKCQRDSVIVAAQDLGFACQLNRYYHEKGYRWYHILPDITFKRPSLFFTQRYWKKTLFVPCYTSKYFLW